MSLFNHKRLGNETFKLDVDRMRKGWYSDKYFVNIALMLAELSKQHYEYAGQYPNLSKDLCAECIPSGDIEVEMQWFTRRTGKTIVAGLDKALTMLQLCSGYFEGDDFINTAANLQVWALEDGDTVNYDGDPLNVQPVMKVRGRYRDFALLETPTLGILTRSSRIATNVYETIRAARGKPMMFFPARFDLHEAQASDGYAYLMGLERYNMDYAKTLGPFISTDAQGDWWGGFGGGTIAHSAIATFLGDTAEATISFARVLPPSINRIALVDFNNDCVTDSLRTARAMFNEYRKLMDAGNEAEAARYILYGVRLDTSGSLRDVSVPPIGDPKLDLGVNPRQVFILRQRLDAAWESWEMPDEWKDRARNYCRNVKIVVSGGFNPERISRFETLQVPVDIYAVGSYLFSNDGPTVTDFTADVVRIKVEDTWQDLAKVGRRAVPNPSLKRVW
jgi:nicotinate phosphoribosyltransferase